MPFISDILVHHVIGKRVLHSINWNIFYSKHDEWVHHCLCFFTEGNKSKNVIVYTVKPRSTELVGTKDESSDSEEFGTSNTISYYWMKFGTTS